MKWALLLTLFLSACAPMSEYKKLKDQLADEVKENDFLHREMTRCEDKNENLKMLLKEKPQKFFVKPSAISPTELEEIKKKAYEDAEKKFKARMQK